MTTVSALLGIAAVLGAVVVAARATVVGSWPAATIVAGLTVLVWAQVTGELLALVHAFRPTPLLLTWAALGTVAAAVAVTRRHHLERPHLPNDPADLVLLAVVIAVLGLTLASGLLIGPTNFDSQTYHLPRAYHWLEHGTTTFFPSPNARENLSTPLPSLLHAATLSADPSLRLVALTQWLAGVVVLCGVALVARLVAPDRRLVVPSLVVALSIPLVVVMTSTTQSDLVVGVPVAGVALAFTLLDERRIRMASTILAASIATAGAVKLTALLLVVPPAVLFTALLLRRRRIRAVGELAVGTVVAGLALAAAHTARLRGTDASAVEGVLSARFSVGRTVGTAGRDLLSLLQVPWARWTHALERTGTAALRGLGIDPSDPATTIRSKHRFEIFSSPDDTSLGAPAQLALAAGAAVALLFAPRSRFRTRAWSLLGIAAAQFLLLATLLRWQPWCNRFFILIVVLLAPIVAGFLSTLPRTVGPAVLAALGCLALLVAVAMPPRGILGTRWVPPALRLTLGVHRSLVGGPPRFDLAAGGSLPVTVDRAVGYAFALHPTRFDLVVDTNPGAELAVWAAVRARAGSILVDHGVTNATPHDRVVRVCLVPCRTTHLTRVRTFTDPTQHTPVVIGLVEPARRRSAQPSR